MQLIRSKILCRIDRPLTEEEMAERQLQRLINPNFEEEEDEYGNSINESSDYVFKECAIDFDRELVVINNGDGEVAILRNVDELILEEDFEEFLTKL